MDSELLRPVTNATLPTPEKYVPPDAVASDEETSPVEVTATETPEDINFDELIDSLPGEELAADPEDITAKFETPEFEAFNTQFKEVLGVDLKDAYNTFLETQKQLVTMRQEMEAQQGQVLLASLSAEWGVTGPELDRRTEKVLQLVTEMEKKKPGSSKQFDSVEGIRTLWKHIESRGARQAPTTGGGRAEPKSKFKASELRTMMVKEPNKYNQMQSVIAEAWARGEVIDD